MGRIKMFFLILCLAGGVVTTLWFLGTFTNVLKFRNIIREIRKIKNILKITTTRVSNRWGMKARNIRKRLGAKAKIEEEMVWIPLLLTVVLIHSLRNNIVNLLSINIVNFKYLKILLPTNYYELFKFTPSYCIVNNYTVFFFHSFLFNQFD